MKGEEKHADIRLLIIFVQSNDQCNHLNMQIRGRQGKFD